MINIAICDDCEADAVKIKEIIENNYNKNKVTTSVFFSGSDLLKSRIFFDIIFLDIELNGENGIDIGNKIKELFYYTLIIYVTHYDSFYSDAFSLHAFQYILKPFNKDNLCNVTEDAINYVKNKRVQNTICLDINNEVINLKLQEIFYLEFVDKKVKVVSEYNIIYLRVSLKYIFSKVKDYDFGIPHKAYIVNFNYIKNIKGNEIILVNSEHIPIAQKRAAIFKKQFNDFLHRIYFVL